jgi:hypothetical protein
MYKTIVDFPNYEINIKGVVRNKTSGKFINIRLAKIGYYTCNLWKENKYKTKYIHRLIAEYFIDDKFIHLQVNHKDGNKLNNDISNLEWVTNKENISHSILNGLTPLNEYRASTKLSNVEIKQIRESKDSQRILAKKFNCSQGYISEIKNNRKRKYIDNNNA